jgi:uncharacterized membrane protein YozB (DUF420 family)
MSVLDALPSINAGFNAISAVLMFTAWRMAKAGRHDVHAKLMVAAFVASALFLVGYLTRVSISGTHTFFGEPWVRSVYLVVLFSHMTLATAVVPLVLRALFLAAKKRFVEHRRIVRFAFPVWMYVSVTGVVVYFMLYHLSAASTA